GGLEPAEDRQATSIRQHSLLRDEQIRDRCQSAAREVRVAVQHLSPHRPAARPDRQSWPRGAEGGAASDTGEQGLLPVLHYGHAQEAVQDLLHEQPATTAAVAAAVPGLRRDDRRLVRAAVLGSPVSHSMSPVLHAAAYAELGLTWWHYEAI